MFKVEIKDGKEVLAGTCKIVSNVATTNILGVLVLIIIGGAFISTGFVPLGIAGIIVVLLLNSILIVPTAWFGALTLFKQRIKESDGTIVVLEEGLKLGWPLINDLLLENMRSKKLTPAEINTEALSKDKMAITIKGSAQYRPDDIDICINMSPKAITDGMKDAIESEIGNTSGLKEADAFVDFRPQIEAIIQCVLKLERMPHHYLDENRYIGEIAKKAQQLKEKVGYAVEESNKSIEKVLKEKEVAGKVMGMIFKGKPENIIEDMESAGFDLEETKEFVNKLSPENWILKKVEDDDDDRKSTKPTKEEEIDVLKFYKDNASRITILAFYEDRMKKKSPVEKLYGIKVDVFRMARPSFSSEAQKAFEESRGARAKMEAAERRFQKKTKMLEKFLGMKISPADAVNLVETTADVKGVERLIISSAAEGSQSVDIIAAAKIIAGKGGGGK